MFEVQPLRAIEYRLVSGDDTIDIPFAKLNASVIELGSVTMGLSVPGALNAGYVRATTNSFPSTGVGVEIGYNSVTPEGRIVAFDRGSSTYKQLAVDGSSIVFRISGTQKIAIDPAGSLSIGTSPINLLSDGTNGTVYVSGGNLRLFTVQDATIAAGVNNFGGNYWLFNNSSNGYAFGPFIDNSSSIGLAAFRASNIFSVLGTFGLATNRNADVYIGANSDTSLAQEAAGTSVANYIIHRRATGTQAARTIVASGNTISSIIADGWDGANWIDAASILMEVDGTPGTNDMPGRIVFKVTPDGSATLATGMTLNNDKVLNVVGGYKINGTAGITTTVTTGSLVGKTITVTNGLITGFA